MSDSATPAWRYLVPGLLFAGMAAYMLWTGEMAVDKQRAMTITRAGNPLVYWPTVVICGTIGTLALYKVWQRIRGS
jgi:hypothetical protein